MTATAPAAAAEPAVEGSAARVVPLARRAMEYWLVSYRRTWRGTLFTGFLSPVLYLAAMGFGLGALVDRAGPGRVEGVPYVQFVAAGVLAATAMQGAVGESTWSVQGAIKWQRQYHAMLASPLRVLDVLVGHLGYVVFRLATMTGVFLLVAALMRTIPSWWALLAWPAAVLVGFAFAAPVFAFSAWSQGDQSFNVLFRFIIMPMFLFSGTFFPISQLPGWLQPVAWVTPLWHGVALCRDLCLGRAQVPASLAHVAVLLAYSAVGLVLAHVSFRRRLGE